MREQTVADNLPVSFVFSQRSCIEKQPMRRTVKGAIDVFVFSSTQSDKSIEKAQSLPSAFLQHFRFAASPRPRYRELQCSKAGSQ
jgi:hypothetical protein